MNNFPAPSIGKIWLPIGVAALAVVLATLYVSRHRLSGENYEAFGVVALAGLVALLCTVRVLTMSVRAMAALRARAVPNLFMYRTTVISGFAWCAVIVAFGVVAIFGVP